MGLEIDFGEVITVIDHKPIKFNVRRISNDPKSYDPSRIWPLTYIFSPTESHQDLKNINEFNVNVKDDIVFGLYANNEEHPGIHNQAILYGLNRIKPFSTKDAFELDKKEYERVTKELWMEGRKLTDSIRKFFYYINKDWQMQGVSHFDVLDNFYTDKQNVSDSMRFLTKEQTLESVGSARFKLNRGPASTDTYHINPLKFQEIENRYQTIIDKTSNIDLNNHHYYKMVQTESEIDGKFAFVLMPFKEEEFPQEIHRKVYEPTVREVLGINCVKVDSDNLKNFIENKIYSHIIKSELIIAEVSTENRNVIFELALSFGFEKVIIPTYFNKYGRDEKKLSFDYEHFDTIFYDDLDELRTKLKAALEAIKKKTTIHSPPS